MNIMERYYEHLTVLKNERLAAQRTVKQLQREDAALSDQLFLEYQHATFAVRQYGKATFFCWLHHPAITGAMAPWPAARMPKAVAMMDIAKALQL